MANKRELVVKEIVETEQSFNSQIKTCLDVFVKQWTQSQKSLNEIGDQGLAALLSELEVLAQFNSALLKEIQEAWTVGHGDARMGKIFKEFAPFLKMFATYLGLYEKWSSKKPADDDEYTRFSKACESDPRCKGLNLNSFLITPVQRVPRYRLLLEELFKQTPSEHIDYKDLEIALKLVAQAAGHNNEKMGPAKLNENSFESLSKLQLSIFDPTGELNLLDWPARKLELGPIEMKKLCRKGPKSFTFWLFSDLLLYAQKSTTVQRAAFAYQLNRIIRLEECALADTAFATLSQRSTKRAAHLLRRAPDIIPRERSQCFQMLSSKKSFIVEAPTIKDAAVWREAIERLRADALKRDHTLHSDRPILVPARAPVWTPDRAVSACEACIRPFTVVRRRHHCRDCGKCFCSECTSHTKVLPHLDSKKKQRVCDACFSKPTVGAPPLPSRDVTPLPSQALPSGLIARNEDDDDTDDDDENDFDGPASPQSNSISESATEFNPYAMPPPRRPPPQQSSNLIATTSSPALPPRNKKIPDLPEPPSFDADTPPQSCTLEISAPLSSSADSCIATPTRPPPLPPAVEKNIAKEPTRKPPPPPRPPPAALLAQAPPPREQAPQKKPQWPPINSSSPQNSSSIPDPPPRKLMQWPPANSVSPQESSSNPKSLQADDPPKQLPPAVVPPQLPKRQSPISVPTKKWPPAAEAVEEMTTLKKPTPPAGPPPQKKSPKASSLFNTPRQWPPSASSSAPASNKTELSPTIKKQEDILASSSSLPTKPPPPKSLPPKKPPTVVSSTSTSVAVNGGRAKPYPIKESAAMIAAKRAATLRRQSEIDMHQDDDDDSDDEF